MTEPTPLRQLARILHDRWEEIVAAGDEEAFEAAQGEVTPTPRNVYYWLSDRAVLNRDDDTNRDHYDAEIIVGLCEELHREYDDMTLGEIKRLLGVAAGERP